MYKSHRKVSILLILALILSACFFQDYAIGEEKFEKFSGGDGTEEKPFLISNVKDLMDLSEVFLSDNGYKSDYFQITGDIDLGENIWTPICSGQDGFKGVFDGRGKNITIRNMADGKYLGLFGKVDQDAIIKNLSVTGIINKRVRSTDNIYFGLVASNCEGTVVDCKTKGNINLDIESLQEIFVGGAIGFGRGSFNNIKNEASIYLNASGKSYIYLGGVLGQSHNHTTELSYMTNTGTITGIVDGMIRAGGIAGVHGFGPQLYSVLNQGDIKIEVRGLSGNEGHASAGGIVGELRNSNLDKAVNKGRVFISFPSSIKKQKVEVAAGGLIGIGEHCKVTNGGNEGNIEGRDGGIHYTAGIIAADGREAYIANVYNRGNVYSISPIKDSELYTSGIVGNLTTADNFYNSGSVKRKEGALKEVDSEAFTNIRPGENTKSMNYGYWQKGILPFPLLIKEQPTTSSFNPDNGRLSRNVNISGKAYNDITEALNVWVNIQSGEYLKWYGTGIPTFSDGTIKSLFGYRNKRDDKWLNASDWAIEWLDKADVLNIIPELLLNKDMTKGITRREFSALSVMLYEHLSGEKIKKTGESPFADIDDEYVTKAYNLGIVTGVGDGLFAPNEILTREQASTMLGRVYEKIYDAPLDIEGVERFADDGSISPWAKNAVYFMAKSGILNGIGNNIFAPKYEEGRGENYGRATREQAFKIAVGMMEAGY
jgi:hypothetical protein